MHRVLMVIVLLSVPACQRDSRAHANDNTPRNGEEMDAQPLAIHIANQGKATRFLSEPGLEPCLRCQLHLPGASEGIDCLVEDPFCLEPCPSDGSMPEVPECAKPVDYFRPIAAGAFHALEWDRRLRTTVTQGGAHCYRLEVPPEGALIELSVCSHGEVQTFSAEATRDQAEGLRFDGNPSDTAECSSARVRSDEAGPVQLSLR